MKPIFYGLFLSSSFALADQWTNYPDPKGVATNEADCEAIFKAPCYLLPAGAKSQDVFLSKGKLLVDAEKALASQKAEEVLKENEQKERQALRQIIAEKLVPN